MRRPVDIGTWGVACNRDMIERMTRAAVGPVGQASLLPCPGLPLTNAYLLYPVDISGGVCVASARLDSIHTVNKLFDEMESKHRLICAGILSMFKVTRRLL